MLIDDYKLYKYNRKICILNSSFSGYVIYVDIFKRKRKKVVHSIPYNQSRKLHYQKEFFLTKEETLLLLENSRFNKENVQIFINRHKYKDLYIFKINESNSYQIIYGNKTFSFKDKSGFVSSSSSNENFSMEKIKENIACGVFSVDFKFSDISFILNNKKFNKLDNSAFLYLEDLMTTNYLYKEIHDPSVLNYRFYQSLTDYKLYKMENKTYLLDISMNGYLVDNKDGLSFFSANDKSNIKYNFSELEEFSFSYKVKESLKRYFNDDEVLTFFEKYKYQNLFFVRLKEENKTVIFCNGKLIDIDKLTLLTTHYPDNYFRNDNDNLDFKPTRLSGKQYSFIKRHLSHEEIRVFLSIQASQTKEIEELKYEIKNNFIITDDKSINLKYIQAISYKENKIELSLKNGDNIFLVGSKEDFKKIQDIHIYENIL